MNTQPLYKRITTAIYLLFEAMIFIVVKLPVQIFSAEVNNALMYLSIVLNAIATLIFVFPFLKGRREDLIPLALLITVFGDLFLTLLGEPYLLAGVLCFCAVETVYALYLKSPRLSIVLRAALFLLLFIGAILTKQVSALNIAAIANISILAVNVFDAWRAKKTDPGLLFRLGITLFFCCDLSLGLSVLLPGTAGSIFGYLIWLFYIPSQVLITLSYMRRRSI